MHRRAVRRWRWAAITTLVLVAVGVAGCVTVEPWQRARLSKRIMSLDPDAVERRIENHCFQTREGSAGGAGSGGGGCGCN